MAQSQYNPVPTIAPTTSGSDYINLRANANAFGAQVGEALERASSQIKKSSDDLYDLEVDDLKKDSEARANDRIANEWAPEIERLRGDYYALDDRGKLDQYERYVKNTQALRSKFLERSSNDFERDLLSGYTAKAVATDIGGAQTTRMEAQNRYTDASNADFLLLQSREAATSYGNPEIVGTSFERADGLIELNGLNRGLSSDEIEEQKRDWRGRTAVSMVEKASTSGDIAMAEMLYRNHETDIPGYAQVQLQKTINAESVRQTAHHNTQAILGGKALPGGIGQPPAVVRATVANTAANHGVDENHALTVLRIESADGQNIGKRGTIGQDKETKGKPLDIQAKALIDYCKQAKDYADKTLGRPSEGWEQYVVYQQGIGGGPALLTAAKSNPMQRAVDVLTPLYSDAKVARDAILHNGGNASMTSGQFLSLLKQKYEVNYARAKCDKAGWETAIVTNPEGGATLLGQPPSPTLGDAILKSHEGEGLAVQTGSNPVEARANFEEAYSDMEARANLIPNVEERNATLAGLKSKRDMYTVAEQQYRVQAQQEAEELASKPDFTSISQIPLALRTKLETMPETMHYLRAKSDYNMKVASGVMDGDMKTYGRDFYTMFQRVNSGDTDISELQGMVGKGLTISGYEKLRTELNKSNTPEGKAEAQMKKGFFAAAKKQIDNSNPLVGIRDPQGAALFSDFQIKALEAYDRGRGDGKTPAQLLSSDSPDYIGKIIPTFQRSQAEIVADMENDYGENEDAGVRTLASIIKDVQSGKLTSEQGKMEALKLGLVRGESAPVVPLAE